MKGSELFAELSRRPPFTKLHPSVAGFLAEYLSNEKAVRFGDRYVVNTNFPPWPSPAFDSLVEQFSQLGQTAGRRLYSVTIAVTNRCGYKCWHCYNAGRSQRDVPLETWQEVLTELQSLGVVMVTLTGGEPLLREDLEDLAGHFDQRTCVVVGTTGAGLTPQRAERLKERGVFAVGVSLDSTDAQEHDRLRGKAGAFETACEAIRIAAAAGLYPYVVAVATREHLEYERFMGFMRFARDIGALEVHVLEPCPTGRLEGQADVALRPDEQRRLFDYQRQIADDEGLPILSSYSYVESPEAFGCGAGLTHLYIDGSGELCPCNLVPLSFGNVTREPLGRILERMGRHFRRPRTGCVGRLVAGKIPCEQRPAPLEVSEEVCRTCLPATHPLPRFFRIRQEARQEVGPAELKAAYDGIHGQYDDFWLVEAACPIEELIGKLPLHADETVFEAGCGTGYATALLAGRVREVVAADISGGMVAEARKRLKAKALDNVRFVIGDALEVAPTAGPFDLVFSSWVLGYIPLAPFFAAAGRALKPRGRLAFVVHKENSPKEPVEIFAELVARDPSVLLKRVAFDFPRDVDQIQSQLRSAGLGVIEIWQGSAVFRYNSPQAVLEHLLKSGAGTAFYEAIDPERREGLTEGFLELLAARHPTAGGYDVSHDFIACVAQKT